MYISAEHSITSIHVFWDATSAHFQGWITSPLLVDIGFLMRKVCLYPHKKSSKNKVWKIWFYGAFNILAESVTYYFAILQIAAGHDRESVQEEEELVSTNYHIILQNQYYNMDPSTKQHVYQCWDICKASTCIIKWSIVHSKLCISCFMMFYAN